MQLMEILMMKSNGHEEAGEIHEKSFGKEDGLIESTKAEMGEMKEENQRLKRLVSQVVNNCRSLQMHIFDIVKQHKPKTATDEHHHQLPSNLPYHLEPEETELVSLRLGSGYKKIDEANTVVITNDDNIEQGLTLGLDCKFAECNDKSLEESREEEEEEAGDQTSPPGKITKQLRSGDDEILQQSHAKKARVSVRVRCETPTIFDGCQWRKYGQKTAKGNPCPRAYYRCSVAPACPVRKQVQRCAEDTSILITTYEGNHNHQLPISASAMASTTTAAASMLMTGSSTSNFGVRTQPNFFFSSSSSPAIAGLNSCLHSLNFDLPNTTISPSYSTITLDLTVPPPSTAQTTQFNWFSSSSNFSLPVPSLWSNKRYMNYGPYQSYTSKYAQNMARPMNQSSLTDSVAKAITSDPSFQSAIQAAITSYVGASGSRGSTSGVVYEQNNGGKDYNSAALITGNVPSSSSPQKGTLESPSMAVPRSKGTVSGSSVDMIRWENMK